MSRFIIGANGKIFQSLDNFCKLRGVALANTATPRWIASQKQHRDFLINARVTDHLQFSPVRILARVVYSDNIYFCMIGFQQEKLQENAFENDLDPAILTVLLSELGPTPTASVAQIRNIVEATDKMSDADYNGHHYIAVRDLFPTIRIFSLRPCPPSTSNIFFKACIEELTIGNSWVDEQLIRTLRTVSNLDEEHIPYEVLCRSIFDSDPSSFYLALYRCLEALYAYSSARDVISSLNLSNPWTEVAIVLEDTLGWHPREDSSLQKLLAGCATSDLLMFLKALGIDCSESSDSDLRRQGASKIYWLRNAIVHYRPIHQSLHLSGFKWAELCNALAGIILDVYNAVL